MKKIWIFTLAFLLTAPHLFSQATASAGLIAKGASPRLVSSDFKFTEGPAVDSEGNVYFTDQPNNRIMKWVPDE